MSGGWNPALRGILVMNDGLRWFAAETGNDTAVNSAVIYYRLGPAGWKAAGSAALRPGVQQNLATITDGRRIFVRVHGERGDRDLVRHGPPRWNLATSNAITAGGQPIARDRRPTTSGRPGTATRGSSGGVRSARTGRRPVVVRL